MSFNLGKMMQSKRAYRRRLAAKPLAEKLCMLDTLRARALTLRRAGAQQKIQHPQRFDEAP